MTQSTCPPISIRFWLRTFLIVTALCAARAGAATIALTTDGKPTASILLAEKPTASAQLAAYELQYHIAKISGATLPIVREPQPTSGHVIIVGATNAAKALGYHNDQLAEQEYVVKTFPQALLLIGRDRDDFSEVHYDDYRSVYDATTGAIGTCYAVHDFLERALDVRWFYPNDSIGTVIPTAASVNVANLNIRRRPDAPIRMVYPLFCNTERLYWYDWETPKSLQSSWIDSRASLMYWIRNRMWGSMPYNANHSFKDYDVAFGKLHPEWFSTKSYEKMQQIDYQTGVQPCFSAPGFFAQVVQIANDYFDGKKISPPELVQSAVGDFFPVMPNDNMNMCGCAECRAQYSSAYGPEGNASTYVWSFVNRVAREVRKKHPNAMITCCAYFNYTAPPKDLIFEPNVAVTFCKFYTEYTNRNYQEQDYQRISAYVHENKAKFFTTWEYEMKPDMILGAFPCLVPHLHAQDVTRLNQIGGFKGGTNQFQNAITYSGDNAGPRMWVSPVMDFMNVYWRMKLYDNFHLDIDQSLEDYYEKFFGPAAADMKRFYTGMEQRWMTQGGGTSSQAWWGKMGTPQFLAEVSADIQKARQKTAADSIYRKRVDLVDAGILQYMLKSRAAYEHSAVSQLAPLGHAAIARVDHLVKPDDWSDDSTWAQALPLEFSKTHDNEQAPQKTTFKLSYDDECLYVHARCMESDTSQIKGTVEDKDVGGFADDSIELFVEPTGKGETYYHLCINSRGAVYDALENPGAIGATATITWDSEARVKTAVLKDCWELRAALPFSALGTSAPKPGSTWRFNLCRNRFRDTALIPFSAWSPTLGPYKMPDRFGIITFNGADDHGRVLWNCDFASGGFASSSETPLIGVEGWYENPAYANQGWDKSWKVDAADGDRRAVCDVNATSPSDTIPFHAVEVLPGVFSIEVAYRRSAVPGTQPELRVTDAQGKRIAQMYAWGYASDIISVDTQGKRENYGDAAHGLGELSAPGKWFGCKLLIDTVEKKVTAFTRSDGGAWIQLNRSAHPYLDPSAGGTKLLLGFGTYKLPEAGPSNVLEMDNVKITQFSVAATNKADN